MTNYANDINPLQSPLKACRQHIYFAGLFNGLVNILYLTPSIFMHQVYDRVVSTRGGTTLLVLTLILGLSLIVFALLDAVRFQLNEFLPKWLAAKDELARTIIRVPVSGRVIGLKGFSVGGVIQAGSPILDIVPDAAPLIVGANFAPTDIDGVLPGRDAEVKFLSLHDRDLPILMGRVKAVSADSIRDEQSGRRFFTAEIAVPPSGLALLRKVRGRDTGIRAVVPVSVLVKLRKRTALGYFIDPITDAFSKSMHER